MSVRGPWAFRCRTRLLILVPVRPGAPEERLFPGGGSEHATHGQARRNQGKGGVFLEHVDQIVTNPARPHVICTRVPRQSAACPALLDLLTGCDGPWRASHRLPLGYTRRQPRHGDPRRCCIGWVRAVAPRYVGTKTPTSRCEQPVTHTHTARLGCVVAGSYVQVLAHVRDLKGNT